VTAVNESLRARLNLFYKDGFVVIHPDDGNGSWLEPWLESARNELVAVQRQAPRELGWIDRPDCKVPFPTSPAAKELIDQLIGESQPRPTTAQISILTCDYPDKGDDWKSTYFNRHVDGAIKQGDGTFKLRWHQLLVGILCTDLPSENLGNPVHWPGSHLAAADQLAKLDGADKIAQQLNSGLNEPTVKMQQLQGRVGTIFVAHHALFHGMAPNNSEASRIALYYRLDGVPENDQKPGSVWHGFRAFHPEIDATVDTGGDEAVSDPSS
jgi:hypothetical protein